jgi:hypothetical protein
MSQAGVDVRDEAGEPEAEEAGGEADALLAPLDQFKYRQ